MHEVVCAAERLSEAAILMRFSGLRSVGAGEPVITQVDLDGDGVMLGAGDGSSSPLCRHLAIVALRPDVVAGAVTTALVGAAQAQGLLITKRQGPHVVAEMPGGSPHRWEWRSVDMQLAIDRQTRDRILLVRFLLTTGASPPFTPRSSSQHDGEGAASAEARRRRPATRALLDALRVRLVELGFNRHGAWAVCLFCVVSWCMNNIDMYINISKTQRWRGSLGARAWSWTGSTWNSWRT